MLKRILVLDGGGAKGPIEVAALKELEINIGKPVNKIFDLVVGTSVGAIVGGILSASDISANEFLELMKEALPQVFHRRLRWPIFQPKYNREVLVNVMNKYIKNKKMKDCYTKYMCTSVNVVDGRTHFFKSWEQKDGETNLIEVINRSYAAPLYFDSIVDEANKAVWLDGGTGNMNCPLGEAYIELVRQGWESTRVHILSIGAGYSDFSVPFNKAKNYNNLRQIAYYMNPDDGGLARLQSTNTQVEWIKNISKGNPNISFQRLDCEIPNEMNGMDKIKYIDDYIAYGKKMATNIDYKPFV
jgi:hypothetical protein